MSASDSEGEGFEDEPLLDRSEPLLPGKSFSLEIGDKVASKAFWWPQTSSRTCVLSWLFTILLAAGASYLLLGEYLFPSLGIESCDGAYSLWYELPGEVKGQIQGEIQFLAQRYHTPQHEGHVTLLGSLYPESEEHIVKACKELASVLRPMTVTYDTVEEDDRVGSNATLLRFPYNLRLRGTVTPELKEATDMAARLLGANSANFFVHSSLLFLADDAPASRSDARALAEEHLFGTGSGGSSRGLNDTAFTISRFGLWRTPLVSRFRSRRDLKNCLSQWKLVQSFDFTRPGR